MAGRIADIRLPVLSILSRNPLDRALWRGSARTGSLSVKGRQREQFRKTLNSSLDYRFLWDKVNEKHETFHIYPGIPLDHTIFFRNNGALSDFYIYNLKTTDSGKKH